MRVLFWGTPDFAVPPLAALLGEGLEVIAVVTQPDKPQGRSRSSVVASPVKTLALREEIPVLQPVKARDPQFVEEIRKLAPDISVVVAYGQILSKEVIDLPKRGTLNIHASLLPALRGAAPIQGAILAGLAETGISIMQMVPELDAGPVLHQVKTPIGPDETYGELALRLSELGALAIVEALALMSAGAASPKEQDPALVTHAPKVTRDAARIDWTRDAPQVSRVIRAYDPRPAAFTTANGSEVKLFHPSLADGLSGNPGQTLEDGNELVVACGEGAVRISEVQPAGRRRMAAGDWTRGRAVVVGDILG
ncbi:MAG: methionyl-tRNA formyltransferase [Gemmatimonadaceae bacterium]|nr:methionyl-tRNA formyltransferase [Gemmatimonadaceae bacterium]